MDKGKSYCSECLLYNRIDIQKRANSKRKDRDKKIYLERNPGQMVFQIQRQRIVVLRKRNPTLIRTRDIIGCDHLFLQKYLESKFKEGMSWQNYGLKTWHIDHIKPVSLFDIYDDCELIECFNYTNLQPLWASENLLKRNKY